MINDNYDRQNGSDKSDHCWPADDHCPIAHVLLTETDHIPFAGDKILDQLVRVAPTRQTMLIGPRVQPHPVPTLPVHKPIS